VIKVSIYTDRSIAIPVIRSTKETRLRCPNSTTHSLGSLAEMVHSLFSSLDIMLTLLAPTEKQTGFIKTLAAEKGIEVDPTSLNKGEASQKINELKNMETKNAGATGEEPTQDPNTWATGDDKATPKQMGYIAMMAKEAGENAPGDSIGKSEASKKIEDLKVKTGM